MNSDKQVAKSSLEFSPPDIIGDVGNFLFGAQPEMIVRPNEVPNKKTLSLAHKLIYKEVIKDLLPNLEKLINGAYSQELMATLLDDIVDSVYVLSWTAIALNLPFNPAWHVVHEANISKFSIHVGCDGLNCYLINEPLQEEIEYEGARIQVTTTCRRGRLLCTNDDTGKIIKPKDFKAPDVWGVLHHVWNEYAKANPPKSMSPPDINDDKRDQNLGLMNNTMFKEGDDSSTK